MRTVGLIGGLGPETTVDYYRRIIAAWQASDPATAPHLIIDSIDVQRIYWFVEFDRAGLADYLLAAVERLARGGADFAAITANMPHLAFDAVAARSPIPLVSIVTTCSKAAKQRGARRLALLGTRFTMEASMYPDDMRRHGIELVTPEPAERTYIHDHYSNEMIKGTFRSEVRDHVESIVARMRDEDQIDGVILGGTELAILLPNETVAGLPAFNTTALHVDAIVSKLRA
jgi:aspartate racemase